MAGRGRASREDLRSGAIVVGLAIAASAAWVSVVHSAPLSDYGSYFNAARGMALGHGLILEGHPSAYWPVGYPAFLAPLFALFGASMSVVKAANVVLHGAAALLAWMVARRLMGHGVALAAGIAVAVWPDLLFYCGESASENLFVPLLLGFLLLLVMWVDSRRLLHAAAAGAVLGACVLTRVTAQGLVVLVPAAIVLLRRSRAGLVPAAALLVAFALVVSPWVARNAIRMGAPVITTNSGVNLVMANNPKADGGYNVAGLMPAVPLSSPANEVLADRTYTKRALSFILGHPGDALRLVPAKAYHLFQREGIVGFQTGAYVKALPAGTAFAPSALERAFIDAGLGYQSITTRERKVLALLCGVALVCALMRRDSRAMWPLLVVGYWLAVHVTIGYGAARYLIAVMPVMLLLAFYVLDSAILWTGRSRSRTRSAVA